MMSIEDGHTLLGPRLRPGCSKQRSLAEEAWQGSFDEATD